MRVRSQLTNQRAVINSSLVLITHESIWSEKLLLQAVDFLLPPLQLQMVTLKRAGLL
jgi:hypothetical protein